MAHNTPGYGHPYGGFADVQDLPTSNRLEDAFPTLLDGAGEVTPQINTGTNPFGLPFQASEINQETSFDVTATNGRYLILDGWRPSLMPFGSIQDMLNGIHGDAAPTAISRRDYEEHGLPVQTENHDTFPHSQVSALQYPQFAGSLTVTHGTRSDPALGYTNSYNPAPEYISPYNSTSEYISPYGPASEYTSRYHSASEYTSPYYSAPEYPNSYHQAAPQEQPEVGQHSLLQPPQFQFENSQFRNPFATAAPSYGEYTFAPSAGLGPFLTAPGSSPQYPSGFTNPGAYNTTSLDAMTSGPPLQDLSSYLRPGAHNTTSHDAMPPGRSLGNRQRRGRNRISRTPYANPAHSANGLHFNHRTAASYTAQPPGSAPALSSARNGSQRALSVAYRVSAQVEQKGQQSIQSIQQNVQMKPEFRTKMEILVSMGDMKYAMLAGTVLSHVPNPVQPATTIKGLCITKSITVEQLAHAKRAEPMALLLARYGERTLLEHPPTQEFLQAIDRRENPNHTTYTLPRRQGFNKEHEVDLTYDVTTFHPGQYWWDGETVEAINLPEAFYRSAPDLPTLHWRQKPPAIVDENGDIVIIGSRTLLDFEILPDKIGRNEVWWYYETCFRLDPRVEWDDLIIRMIRNDGSNVPKFNLLQMQCSRGRTKWGMKAVSKHRANQRVDFTTTRGLTPGLIDPTGPDVPRNRVVIRDEVFSGFKCFTDMGDEVTPAEDLTELEAQEEYVELMFLGMYPVATVTGAWPSH